MTLTSLRLRGFKCFRDLELGLATLTLFTGFNAGGKSTALQGLLLLAQAFRAGQDSQTLSLNGPLVRLGSPGDVLSNFAEGRSLSFDVAADAASAAWFFEADGASAEAGVLKVIRGESRVAEEAKTWKHAFWRQPARSGKSLSDALAGLVFLSAVRAGPAEAFPTPDDGGQVWADVGTQGEYAPWWYAQSADVEVLEAKRHPEEPASSFRRQLDAYLGDLFPGGQANAEYISRTSLARLELRTALSEWRRPANIGYGLTYAFPILVALLLANAGQVVVIDSPEAHLHPRAQSQMGRIIAKFANAGVQIFVETHSDHVLRGVLLAAKTESIKSNDVKLHFFTTPTESANGVTTLSIDQGGNVEAWPPGFFDQSEVDNTKLAGWG